ARGGGGEPGAAQDEIRRFRGHGACRLGRRTGNIPHWAGCRSTAGHARKIGVSQPRCCSGEWLSAPMTETSSRTLVCSIAFLDIVEYSKKAVADQLQLKHLFNAILAKAL